MSIGSRLRTAQAQPSAEEKSERRRMSFYDLFFLAAGGVIGSGWLFGAVQADQGTGSWAVLSWLIGGALMLVIVAVMVELSTVVPKTGGLTFLPLQSSGPLLATVVAAGVWVFYAVDPASEAVAMVRGLAAWSRWPAVPFGPRDVGNPRHSHRRFHDARQPGQGQHSACYPMKCSPVKGVPMHSA